MSPNLFLSLIVYCLRDRAGHFAVGFALLAPLLFGLAGGAVDMIAFERNLKRMQHAADIAALAAAREGSLQGWDEQIASQIAAQFAAGNLEETFAAAGEAKTVAMSDSGGQYRIATAVDQFNKTVTVTIENDYYPYFFLGYFRHSPQISVQAQANVSGEMNICVIGLDPASAATFQLSDDAKLTAPKCAVFSNSVATDGFIADGESLLTSDYNCSAGGFVGAARNFSGKSVTDCRPVDDPLAARGAPASSSCNFTNKTVSGLITFLNPGVYCGGIRVTNKANVVFKPGTYVIKDGEFKSDLGGILGGVGVTFVFVGPNSRFNFDATTIVAFSAPETGAYAGILFYQDPMAPWLTTFEISSKEAGILLGTIYLPNGIFKVHAANRIGDKSAYTVIIARKLDIGATADLVINANYASTKVPVPDGVGPSTGAVKLIR
ncbi:MAG: pilus assembly protein TadG-related protein [Rhizobiaceae bacterium]